MRLLHDLMHHYVRARTWNIAPSYNISPKCFVVDPDVDLIAATEPGGEGDLDEALAGGRGRLNDMRDHSGGGTLVSNTTPKAVRGLEQVG